MENEARNDCKRGIYPCTFVARRLTVFFLIKIYIIQFFKSEIHDFFLTVSREQKKRKFSLYQ